MNYDEAIVRSNEAKSMIAKDPELASNLAAKIVSEAELHKNLSAVYDAYYILAIYHHHKGEDIEAFEAFSKQLVIGEEMKLVQKQAASLNNMGNVLLSMRNYSDAVTYFYQALAMYEEEERAKEIASLKINLGIALKNLNNLDEALLYFKASLRYALENNLHKNAASIYLNIGNVYCCRKQYDLAKVAYTRALNMSRNSGDLYGELVALNNIGDIHFNLRNYEEATAILTDCYNRSTEAKFSNIALQSQIYLAKTKISTNSFDEAEADLNAADMYSKPRKDFDALQSIYESFAILYEKKNDSAKALSFYKDYMNYKTEVEDQKNTRQINELKHKHELNKRSKEAEIQRLEHVGLKTAFENLSIERNRSEQLLLNILPKEIADELKKTGSAKAKQFLDTTVLFTDFKNFTLLTERLNAEELVGELNTCFKKFDEITTKYKIEKVKTVGDAYVAVCGLPLPNTSHAVNIVKAALEIRDFMVERKKELGNKTCEIRIGICTGAVIAGLVGTIKFVYDIWGDTVNTAARMEQACEVGKVNIHESTYHLVSQQFDCKFRGQIPVKSKGLVSMYYIENFQKKSSL